MSYQSKDQAVLRTQLKVQEVCVKLSDVELVSVAGLVVTVKLGEPIKEIKAAIHIDDNVGAVLIPAANRVITGSQVALTLANALVAADAIILKYEIQE
jgi:hypothetical protein